MEQCSSESTARFKSNLVNGNLAADLTGGFGVDSFFLSQKFSRVVHVDVDQSLIDFARHNHEILGAKNIEYRCATAESWLENDSEQFHLIFLDPSRRTHANRKVFKFADCSPNAASLLPKLLRKSDAVLIKASPMIDIHQATRELGAASKIVVVGVENECKEILFLFRGKVKEPLIEAVDLSPAGLSHESFMFSIDEERLAKVTYSAPLKYLYEPNAMILKAGAFKLIAEKYNLRKLAPNTHLYTSDTMVKSFPGRIFSMAQMLKPDSKSALDVLKKGYANIMTRNYPLTPAQLKKKLKTKDGGENYILGFSGIQKKYLVLAERII